MTPELLRDGTTFTRIILDEHRVASFQTKKYIIVHERSYIATGCTGKEVIAEITSAGHDPVMSDDVRIQHFAKALTGWERKARTLHRTVREQSRLRFIKML
ncbi:hypothetical protein [Hydrogenispora ethanolica]|uniref:hypothetical protein n=1 Tax=Hydrogenispora ethanolica TaxID=1082276 RepID=UPI0010466F9D|nr:hypothetical protein [Hydrogenispora ethanolica]